MKIIEREPCAKCPYRVDAPRGLWDPHEFLQLYVNEMRQTGATYACHKYGKVEPAERSYCVGWLLDQRRRGVRNVGLRLRLAVVPEFGDELATLSDGGHELFPDIGSMCRANGVPVPAGDAERR